MFAWNYIASEIVFDRQWLHSQCLILKAVEVMIDGLITLLNRYLHDICLADGHRLRDLHVDKDITCHTLI